VKWENLKIVNAFLSSFDNPRSQVVRNLSRRFSCTVEWNVRLDKWIKRVRFQDFHSDILPPHHRDHEFMTKISNRMRFCGWHMLRDFHFRLNEFRHCVTAEEWIDNVFIFNILLSHLQRYKNQHANRKINSCNVRHVLKTMMREFRMISHLPSFLTQLKSIEFEEVSNLNFLKIFGIKTNIKKRVFFFLFAENIGKFCQMSLCKHSSFHRHFECLIKLSRYSKFSRSL
jgi:hypothetical protein